jgi:hypothetical protein
VPGTCLARDVDIAPASRLLTCGGCTVAGQLDLELGSDSVTDMLAACKVCIMMRLSHAQSPEGNFLIMDDECLTPSHRGPWHRAMQHSAKGCQAQVVPGV